MSIRLVREVSVAVACAVAYSACGGSTPITTEVSPISMTMARQQSVGIFPANCNDWTSPSWKTPQDWWNAINPTTPPKVVGQAVTGFEILFDTDGGNCRKYRQDLYRSGFTYDLSARQNLRGLIQKAEISFASVVLPSGVSPTGLCQPFTAGGGSLWIMNQGASLPAAPGGFVFLGIGPGTTFPAAGKVFGMTFPWIAGSIPANGRAVTTVASGTGGAGFTVDVTDFLNDALNNSRTSMQFMLSGSDEAVVTTFPAGAIDCRTVYRFGNMVITHF